MTIIELARLFLPPPTTSATPQLLANLPAVTQIIEASSGLPTRFFSSLTDPHTMFVIGGWPSVEAHRDGFQGSEEQKRLWPLIDGLMDIQWMEYVDVGNGRVPEAAREGRKGWVLGVASWRVGVLNLEQRTRLQERKKEHTHEGAGIHEVVWAWNIKKGQEHGEEDVLVELGGFEERSAAEKWAGNIQGVKSDSSEKTPEVFLMERTKLATEES